MIKLKEEVKEWIPFFVAVIFTIMLGLVMNDQFWQWLEIKLNLK